jgi:large subunit ribosomal protein L40e
MRPLGQIFNNIITIIKGYSGALPDISDMPNMVFLRPQPLLNIYLKESKGKSRCYIMGKFPLADAELTKIWICRRCKARNRAGSKMCRKCGYKVLRPKRKDARVKK